MSLAYDVMEWGGKLDLFQFWWAEEYVLHTRIGIWIDGGMGPWAVFYCFSPFSLLAGNRGLYVNLNRQKIIYVTWTSRELSLLIELVI
jgi:hypothetical protein